MNRLREEQTKEAKVSVLTINKLTESVGAEVTGVDSERLVDDDLLASAILDALDDIEPHRRQRNGLRSI